MSALCSGTSTGPGCIGMKRTNALLAVAALLVLAISACGPRHGKSRNHSAWERGFHWATATAGCQVERDAADSNWRRYVDRTAGKPLPADNTGPLAHGPIDPYKQADDFRHRYREDIANAHALGVNTFRFGLEWARVMPEPGKWDEKELAYYDSIVATLRENGITPMITLMHWVYPGWIADRGWVYEQRRRVRRLCKGDHQTLCRTRRAVGQRQ